MDTSQPLSGGICDLPEVPTRTITKDGQVVYTSLDVWRFQVSSDGGKVLELDWQTLHSDYAPYGVSPRAIHIFPYYLARRHAALKGHTVRNDF